MPSIQLAPLELFGHRIQGSIEVVDDGQQLAQQRLAGQTQLALSILGRPALEVGEVGRGSLQTGQVLGRQGPGCLELPLQLLDVVHGRRSLACLVPLIGMRAARTVLVPSS